MERLKWMVMVLTAAALVWSGAARAQGTHSHSSGSGGTKMDTSEVLVEGIKITFQIMANADHLKMLREMKMKEDVEPGTSHNVTVVLTDPSTLKPITDATVSMKVVDPKGKDQIKSLKYEGSMKSFDAYFNLSQKGRYEILVLVRTGDLKRSAGIYYELK